MPVVPVVAAAHLMVAEVAAAEVVVVRSQGGVQARRHPLPEVAALS